MPKSFALSARIVDFKTYIKALILSLGLSLNSRYFKFTLSDRFDYFLAHEHPSNRISTVVHIGAHEGQERFLYERNQVKVFWVEANPYLFSKLRKNLRMFPSQIPIRHCCLVKKD